MFDFLQVCGSFKFMAALLYLDCSLNGPFLLDSQTSESLAGQFARSRESSAVTLDSKLISKNQGGAAQLKLNQNETILLFFCHFCFSVIANVYQHLYITHVLSPPKVCHFLVVYLPQLFLQTKQKRFSLQFTALYYFSNIKFYQIYLYLKPVL